MLWVDDQFRTSSTGCYAVRCGGPMDRLAISFGGTWQPDYLHGSGCTKLCKGYYRSAASALKAVTQARSVSFYGALDVEPQQVVLGQSEAADGCF